MRKVFLACMAILMSAFIARAQDAQLCSLPASLDQLKAKAAEVVDVNLGSNLLVLAGNSINKQNANEAEVKKMLSNIKGICVRSYKFGKDTQYLEQDIETLRSQFNAPAWSSVVRVRNKNEKENVDVLFKTDQGSFAGIAVIVAKPEEFTFVRIEGAIDLSLLSKLGGQFGIPKMNIAVQSKPEPKPEPKTESK
jgi:hypothetical protein